MAQPGIVGSDVRFKCDYHSGGCQRNCHRPLGCEHRLESIQSIQADRVVSNDYVVRLRKRFYKLLPPVHLGGRGGRVVIEQRLDGSMAIRFGKHYLSYPEVTDRDTLGGTAPDPPGLSRLGGRCQQEAYGTGAGAGIRARWHTAHRRALESHSCGALFSRRRGWG